MKPVNKIFVYQLGIICGLIVATAIAFSPVLQNEFINFDDPGYVTTNPHVRSGLTWSTFTWAFRSWDEANWHPLTWLSHALDCSLFGLDARFHHGMSLAIHLCTSLLLFHVLHKMTGRIIPSGVVAMIFAVHPLHVESVAWVAERKDVLSAFFFVLVLMAYVWYRQRPSAGRMIVVAVLFIGGLLSKPMLVTLPFLLLVIDYWPVQFFNRTETRRRPKKNLLTDTIWAPVKEKLPLILLAMISGLMTYLAQQEAGSTKVLAGISLQERIGNAIASYGKYIGKAFLPINLSVFYPHPENQLPMWEIVAGIIVLSCGSIVAWKRRIRQPYLLVGWLWFLGTLLPVIGLIQVGRQGMADRYMYIPLIGLSIMIVWGLSDVFAKYSNRILLACGLLVVTCTMAYATWRQAGYWKNSQTLFERAITVTTGNYIAHNNLGAALADSGNHLQALDHLRKAIQIRPDYIPAHHNLARSLVATGQRTEALRHYAVMLSALPNDAGLHARIGELLAEERRTSEAISSYLRAAQLDPTNGVMHRRLGELYLDMGQIAEAKNSCQRAINLNPEDSHAHVIQGIIAAEEGDTSESQRALERAIHLDPHNIEAYQNLSILYERIGDKKRASDALRRAVAANPANAETHLNLGIALATDRNYIEAEEEWKRAVELQPNLLEARVNLAKLYVLLNRPQLAEVQFNEALRIDPHNAELHYQFGKFLVQNGKTSKARFHFRESIRIAPSFPDPKIALESIP